MRILHISKYAQTGGVETFVRDLSVEQVRAGHDVTVLCHRDSPLKPTESLRVDGVTLVRCAILFRTAFAPVAPLFAQVLQAEITRSRPDVIHLHLPNPAVLFQAALPADIPLVIHWHADVDGATHPLIKALYPLYRPFEQRCLARASAVIATSPPYLESSAPLAKWQAKCTVIPLGLDLDRYPADAPTHPDRPLILSVGRFTYYKGFENLIRAAAMVEGADFVIVGDGQERPQIIHEIKRLGVSDRVTLTGHVTDAELRDFLQRATLFCLPSVDRGEAFGVVLLEAMRYGLPLVSTAVPGTGMSWVNRDRETGLVVPPANPEQLASALRALLEDPAQAREFGQASRQRFEDEFTIARAARLLVAIYQDAAKA